MDLSKEVKDIVRFEEILLVFFEEGLGYYLSRTKLHLHLPWTKRIRANITLNKKEDKAIHVRKSFERLGPTFVKLGQLLSLRPDLVSKEFCKEFGKLQDNVPKVKYADIKSIIETELGKPINKLFKSFDKKSLASASIAQVHKAVLKTGQTVAVKVQRPNIKEIINADLDILFYFAKKIEKYFPESRNFRPVEVVKEFALWTHREINFKNELNNALRLKEAMEINENVKIPKIYSPYCTKKVLVMKFVNGVKIDDFSKLKKWHISKKKLATSYVTSIFQQAFIAGFFHADPHPANIFVLRNGKLVYLDYGIVGELNSKDRKIIIDFIKSVPEQNLENSFDILLSLAREIHGDKVHLFKEKSIAILKEVQQTSISEKSFGKAIYEILSLGAKYGIVFDSNHILITKAIYQAEGLGLKMYPEFSVAKSFEDFYKDYLMEEISPVKFIKNLKIAGEKLLDHKELILELPEHIIKIIDNLEKENLGKENVCPPQTKKYLFEDIEQHLEKTQHQHDFWLITMILFLASIFILYLEGYTIIYGLKLSIVTLFIIILLLFIKFIFLNKK